MGRTLIKYFTLKNLVISFLLLGFIFVLRWNSFSTPFERDEGEYAYSAWIMKEGGVPYRDTFLQKPPLIVYTYLAGYLINPSAVWPTRFFAFIFAFLSALLLAVVSGKKYGEDVGWSSAFLLAIMLGFPYFAALSANTEIFMVFPLTITFCLFLWFKEKADYKVWLISAITSSLAILYKPIAIAPLIFLYVYWIFLTIKSKEKFSELVVKIFLAFVGSVATVALTILPFLHIGGIKEMLDLNIVFNLMYAKMWDAYGLSGFYLQMGKLVRVWWIVPVLAFCYFLTKQKEKALFSGLIIMCLLVVYRTTIGHYYILFMPFLSLIMALGLKTLISIINRHSKFTIHYSFALFAIVVLMVIPIREQFG